MESKLCASGATKRRDHDTFLQSVQKDRTNKVKNNNNDSNNNDSELSTLRQRLSIHTVTMMR